MSILKVKNLSKSFSKQKALDNISFEVKPNKITGIVGPDGAGKTTLLRILAGLENATGTLKIDNEYWLNEKYSKDSQKRDIGFVFQDYALFPNFTVLQNLLYVKKDK